MAFRINGTTVINRALGPFTNLNSLPYYDYEFDDHYLLDGELNPMNKQILRKRLSGYPVNKPILVSVTSRGCPQTCSYCNNCRYVKLFGHNIIRLQSPRRVIEEIEFILKRLDFIDFIGFGDDDFFVRPLQEIQEFCEIYKSRISLPFGVAVSANTFSRKKMQFLFEAGLKVLQLGVQSGSQRLLDEVYSRKVKLSKTESVIKLVSEQYEKHGLNLIVDFIIDNPYETKNDIYQSFQFISKMPISAKINLFSLAFFPGTPLYDRALKDGIVDLTLQTSSRFYSSKGIRLRYQLNYETFLILLAKQLRSKFGDHGKLVEPILKILGTRTMRKIGALMPKQFYQYSVRLVS